MTIMLVEDYEALTLEQQREIFTEADTIRRERDERELFDLIRNHATPDEY